MTALGSTYPEEVANMTRSIRAAEEIAAMKVRLNLTEEDVVNLREASDGSSASYYKLPAGATELQHLINFRNMNGNDAEVFRALYRKGLASHSDELRDAKKNVFYTTAEVERLEGTGPGLPNYAADTETVTPFNQEDYTVFVNGLTKNPLSLLREVTDEPIKLHLMHLALGIAGEAGELVDVIKKHTIYNQPLDTEHLIEKLGDLMFYITAVVSTLNLDMPHIQKMNRQKLDKRYSKGYSNFAAAARRDKDGVTETQTIKECEPYWNVAASSKDE